MERHGPREPAAAVVRKRDSGSDLEPRFFSDDVEDSNEGSKIQLHLELYPRLGNQRGVHDPSVT